ncbi:MAG: glycyl-radical enzyme activating protein [Bacteroidales bacterium]|nr:glycyl-radical enzyme activating protein [Bacteroidales bacterium]MCF8388495.1 glycyl-radical enzyme activating protein [Bacteroidales bacterium]
MISNKTKQEATIFDIQGLSVHDGPGCRTLIFMKGCSLNCYWCSNPEGMAEDPVLLHFQSNCILCGNCIQACPSDAISIKDGKLFINRQKCRNCADQACARECYNDALRLCGYNITLDRLLEIIRRDRQFWGLEGGISLTGGEPLLQIDFVEELLRHCYESNIHTAVETCGNVPWNNFKRVLPWVDWFFFDIKHLSKQAHQKATGAGNRLILDNAKKLARNFTGNLIFRLPLVPGFNDSHANIMDTINFIRETGKNEINILPLHHLGREKYTMLGKTYPLDFKSIPSTQDLKEVEKIFEDHGVKCFVGSDTPF